MSFIMPNVNDIQSTGAGGGASLAADRRRAGRKAYNNPHLIELMRLRDDESAAVCEEEPEGMPVRPARPFLALTVACLAFWGGVALLLVKL